MIRPIFSTLAAIFLLALCPAAQADEGQPIAALVRIERVGGHFSYSLNGIRCQDIALDLMHKLADLKRANPQYAGRGDPRLVVILFDNRVPFAYVQDAALVAGKVGFADARSFLFSRDSPMLAEVVIGRTPLTIVARPDGKQTLTHFKYEK
jgi:hypothetical protein